MTWKEIRKSYLRGATEAQDVLTSPSNWTDLMYYIHCSRLILGFVLGFLAAFFLFVM